VLQNFEISLPRMHGLLQSLAFRRTPALRERIEAMAEQVFLAERLGDRAGQLSHGQKQWLEIGMLLMQEPELLLLDEPVAGMSPREREQTGDLLQRISAGKSVVVIEHDMDFVKRIAHRVTVLHQGKRAERRHGRRSAGRPARDRRLPGALKEISQMLEVSELNVAYGESQVIHDVSLRVAPDEAVAIMGRNGMGKTTLLKS
jgi:ABC-type uncharacterized transport system ATPase subunit